MMDVMKFGVTWHGDTMIGEVSLRSSEHFHQLGDEHRNEKVSFQLLTLTFVLCGVWCVCVLGLC